MLFAKISEEDDNKKNKLKNKYKTLPVRPLHVTGHDMNLCKLMYAQAKYMKFNCPIACGVG